MAFERTGVADAVPLWRGFHHVALVTPDLEATIRFYGDVLGMSVGEVSNMLFRDNNGLLLEAAWARS